MPCFPGNTLACRISTSFRMLESYSTLCCLSTRALHTLCILIGLLHPSEFFPPIHIPKTLLKNSSCGTEAAIDSPDPSHEYYGWPNIVDALGFMNLSTMDPLALPRSLSTVVSRNVYNLFMINVSGRRLLPNFLFDVPWENKFWCRLHPWLSYYCSILQI